MCGIAGLLLREASASGPAGLPTVRAMCEALAHRGPDDHGSWAAGPVAFGHRRLSILDRSSAGRQPMASASGRWVITYNGEIYNYLELRDELRAAGSVFRTDTDTEVILAAWERWGPACLTRMNGMWAFAIWDRREKELLAARDRFGVKPFYYRFLPDGTFAFASEIKALALPGFPPLSVEPEVASRYLAEGEVERDERTFYREIHRLPAASTLRVRPGRPPEVRRFWTLPDVPADREIGAPDAAERLASLLEDAVAKRLRSDVAVGTCLSGGLDSSTVACLAHRRRAESRVTATGQHSFSACFDDPRLDERPFMDRVLRATGIEAHRVFPSAEDLVRDLDDLVRTHDEPFGSTSVYAQYRVFRLAREAGIVVTLDGQGADEILAGYHHHLGSFLADRWREGQWRATFREARNLGRSQGRPLRKLLRDARRALADRTRRRNRPAWIRPEVWGERPEDAAAAASPPGRLGILGRHLHRDLTRDSLPALLRYADRNAMAFGVEARFPFLDYRVVEFLFTLPADLLVRDGFTKWILRRAFDGTVPPEICWRRDKVGFEAPESSWFRGALGAVFEETVLSGRARLGDWCDLDRLVGPWRAFRSGRDSYSLSWFRLLCMETWLRGGLRTPAESGKKGG